MTSWAYHLAPDRAGLLAHFLRPDGIFYVTEVHPVAQALAEEPEWRLGYLLPTP